MVFDPFVTTDEQKAVLVTIQPRQLANDMVLSPEQFAVVVAVAHSNDRLGFSFTVRNDEGTLRFRGSFLSGFGAELVAEIERLQEEAAVSA